MWARLVVPSVVESVKDRHNVETITLRIRKMADGLDAIYDDILIDVIKPLNRPRALLLLEWVGLAERPLSVKELRYAMASDSDASVSQPEWYARDSEYFVASNSRMEALVNTLSGGLAEVKGRGDTAGGQVQFVHESVKEFLFGRKGISKLMTLTGSDLNLKGSEMGPAEQWQQTVARSHHQLRTACLNYFKWSCANHSELHIEAIKYRTYEWRGRREENESHYDLYTKGPFLRYAVTSLFFHVQHAGQGGISQHDIVQDLQLPSHSFKRWTTLNRGMTGGQPKYKPDRGSTLLHTLCCLNLDSAVKLLIQDNDSTRLLEETDKSGNTALHSAARWNAKEAMSALLDAKADTEAKNENGATPLELASVNGNEQIVQLLLKRGAKIDQATGDSGNALQAAALKGDAKLVWILLGWGATVNSRGGRYGSAL
jgi:hypothetical protein